MFDAKDEVKFATTETLESQKLAAAILLESRIGFQKGESEREEKRREMKTSFSMEFCSRRKK